MSMKVTTFNQDGREMEEISRGWAQSKVWKQDMHSYGEGEEADDLLMWSRPIGSFLPRPSKHEAIRAATGRRSSMVGRTGVRT